MKLALLDRKTLGEDLDLSSLQKFGTLTVYDTTTPQETAQRISQSQIVITNKVVIDKTHMEQARELKLICVAATGMNNIDLEAAKALGIEVRNVAGYSTQSVAQHTFALLLALVEQISHYGDLTKSGAWSQSDIFTDLSRPFFEISGKKWGIISMGAIGQEVAKIATAFGAHVSYYSTSQANTSQPYPHNSLEALLKESDIISIHAPFNSHTENLIHRDNLPLLKDTAVILNLGRGGIINEHDLAATLNNKRLYAGLDVTTTEPIESLNPLLHISEPHRLLITPHIAWASIEARKKLLEGIVQNIEVFLESERIQ